MPARVTVDLVARDPRANRIILIVVVGDPWVDDDEQLRAIQSKIGGYLDAIEDGAVWRMYPEFDGQPAIVRVNHAHPLRSREIAFFDRMKSMWFDPADVGFEVNHLNGNPA